MTLPALVNNFKLKAFESAFKKQYSVLSNAIDFLQLDQSLKECYLTHVSCPTDDNPYNGCYSSSNSDCAELKAGLVDKLKLKPVENDVSYPTKAQVIEEGGIAVNTSVSYDNIVRDSSAFILPEGAILMFYNKDTSYAQAVFIVDVNGKQLPNKWGYDVFFMVLSLKNNKLLLTDGYASLANKGGRLPRTILLNENDNNSPNWR